MAPRRIACRNRGAVDRGGVTSPVVALDVRPERGSVRDGHGFVLFALGRFVITTARPQTSA